MVLNGYPKTAATAGIPALLLVHFSLLVTHVAADECGTKFVDPSSSAVLAQIVVQGKVNSMMPASHSSRTHSANITIAKVYKGMDVLKEMGILPEGNVVVDKFGPEEDPDECVADMSAMTAEEGLLFFLRPAASHGVLQLTALPLPAELSLRQTVEGSLCDSCVSPPEIQRVMCQKCAHAPAIKKGKSRKVRMGQKARLGCYARGKPPPKFSWTKFGVPVNSGSGGVVIRSTNTSSILIIRKTARAHGGQYTCKAENEIGESEKMLLLEVIKQTPALKPKYNVRRAPDRRVCDRAVCLNGGTCYYSPSLDLSFCKCTKEFEGVKCENDISAPVASSNDSKERHVASIELENAWETNNMADKTVHHTPTITSGTSLLQGQNDTSSFQAKGALVYSNTSQGTSDIFATPPVEKREHGKENIPSSNARGNDVVDCDGRRDFCLNGGTCYFLKTFGRSVCNCAEGFNGIHCQFQDEPVLSQTLSASSNNDSSESHDAPREQKNVNNSMADKAVQQTSTNKSGTTDPTQNGTSSFKAKQTLGHNNINQVKPRVHAREHGKEKVSSLGKTRSSGPNDRKTHTEFVIPKDDSSGGLVSLKEQDNVNNSMEDRAVQQTSTITSGTSDFTQNGTSSFEANQTLGHNNTSQVKPDTVYKNASQGEPDMNALFHVQTRDQYKENISTAEPKARNAKAPKPKKGTILFEEKRSNFDKDPKGINSNCSDYCMNGGTCRLILSRIICLCPTGFEGKRCQTPLESDSVPCSKTTANICLNGGTCYYSITLARTLCRCVEGFKGSRCEKSVLGSEVLGANDSLSRGRHHISKFEGKSSGRSSQKLEGSPRKSSSADKTPAGLGDLDDEALNKIISRLRNSRIKAGRCNSKTLCSNKGKCRYIHKLALQVCLCRAGYTGKRCEHPE